MSLFILMLSSSCKNEKVCEPDFFTAASQNRDSVMAKIFPILRHSQFIKGQQVCGYDFSFVFWVTYFNDNGHNSPYYNQDGFIYSRDSCIYYVFNGANESYKLFDFKLKLGSEESIQFDYSYIGFDKVAYQNGLNQYSLRLDDRFLDSQNGDEIFTFRFHKMKYLEERADLVFFVSYQHGIVGFYNTNIRDKADGDGVGEAQMETAGKIFPERNDNMKTILRGNRRIE